MPTTSFHGFVSPRGFINGSSGQGSWDDPFVKGVTFRFDIVDSLVSVHCETQTPDQVPQGILLIWSLLITRGALDAVSFVHGAHFSLVLNEVTQPDGKRVAMLSQEKALAALCTVSLSDIHSLAHKEMGILKHLHDLSETILNPLDSEVNCGRAVDGFARLLLPGKDQGTARWQMLQKSLNLTKDYIKFVTDLSTGPRHGAIDPQSLPDIIEVRRRAWVIANRFLEFRKRGNLDLADPDFPLL
jgi:hypothetical protein